jgi:hypothetical protein
MSRPVGSSPGTLGSEVRKTSATMAEFWSPARRARRRGAVPRSGRGGGRRVRGWVRRGARGGADRRRRGLAACPGTQGRAANPSAAGPGTNSSDRARCTYRPLEPIEPRSLVFIVSRAMGAARGGELESSADPKPATRLSSSVHPEPAKAAGHTDPRDARLPPVRTRVRTPDAVGLIAHDFGGTGAAVVCAHATGLHGMVWQPLVARLAHEYRCGAHDTAATVTPSPLATATSTGGGHGGEHDLAAGVCEVGWP